MSETQERDERVTFKMRIILIWAIESERQFIFIHWNPNFLAFVGEGLPNEQGYLDSLCASPFRLHNTVVSLQLRLIAFFLQSFFKNITGFEDSKASLTTP